MKIIIILIITHIIYNLYIYNKDNIMIKDITYNRKLYYVSLQ